MTVIDTSTAVSVQDGTGWDADADALGTDPGDADTWAITRLCCPDCRRPIALLDDEERLPLHAAPKVSWQPFSATVCAGSGRPVADAGPVPNIPAARTLADFLTLPPELDWRTQPFSHAS